MEPSVFRSAKQLGAGYLHLFCVQARLSRGSGSGKVRFRGVSVGLSGKHGCRGAAIAVMCVLAGALCLSGCDDYNIPIYQTNTGVSAGGTSGITVTIAPSGIIFVDIGKSREISVTLTNDTGNQGVNWTLTGPGTLSQATPTTVIYTAPTTQDTPATVSATSVSDSTQVASATVYSVPLPAVSTTSLPGGTVGTEYSQVVDAVNGAAPYSWSVASGSLPSGVTFTVSSSAAITVEGVPATAGTYNFTLEITDVCSVAAKQAFTVVIAAASGSSVVRASALGGSGSNNSLLNGNYAFQFGGSGPGGMIGAAGNLSADGNGNVTSGIVDRSSATGVQKALPFTGSYAVGTNQLGDMTLNYADGTSTTYAVAVSGDGNARFIEFDDLTGTGTRGSGILTKQDASSLAALNVAGNYVFELSGVDAQGSRMATAGQFSLDASGTISAGIADVNDAGTMTSQAALTGNVLASGSRAGSAVMNVAGFAGPVHLSLYLISAEEMYAVETDGAGQPLMVGTILRQSGGPFSTATLAGNDVIQMSGESAGATQMVFGLISADGAGNTALSAAQMTSDGVSQLDTKYAAAVSATGRTILGASPGSMIIFLANTNSGFVLGTDASVMTGWIGASPSQTLTRASFVGTMTGSSMISGSAGMTDSIVALSFDGKGNVSGTGASSGPTGLTILPIQQGSYQVGAGDIFVTVTWPLQNPQPMLIAAPNSLILVPSQAGFAPIVVNQ